MRDLEQHARAVSRVRFTATRAPVVEVDEDGERLLEDLVGSLAFHLANESDTTRVVFELRIVEPEFFGLALSVQL